MQPQRSSRIDVAELKGQIVKRIGVERSKRYFYYLNRLLSQKLSKGDFDKFCYRVIGRENLPLHNQFIRSILKNACNAKTPPPIHEAGPAKLAVEDGHEQSRSHVATQIPSAPVWSNGVVLPSLRKGGSGIRDRKLRDRPSPLGPNGKADNASYQTMTTEDGGNKVIIENGDLTPYDYQRPVQHPQGLAERPENAREASIHRPMDRPSLKKSLGSVSLLSKDNIGVAVVEDGEEVEQENQLNFSRTPLLAPLGIPLSSASVGAARKALPVASSSNYASYCDNGEFSDTEMLRKRMEQMAAAQGLGGVSLECANVLNNMLDVYLKRLIRSCVELVGARSANEPKKHPNHKQQIQGKLINGLWPSNHLHMQNSGGHMETMQEQRTRPSISLLDFKVAMELNPQQLGEDWPLLLEKICMNAFEE